MYADIRFLVELEFFIVLGSFCLLEVLQQLNHNIVTWNMLSLIN